jgi:clan AA aspartic protease (TIGR02281 family)
MKLAEMTSADAVKAALIVLVLAVAGGAMAAGRAEAQQSNLPRCPRHANVRWHNCFGTWTDYGAQYVGEFKFDKPDGQGSFTYASGDKYVGEFKDGEINGQGTLTFTVGDKYVGEFKLDEPDGQGTYTYANGDKYVGEFKRGKPNGQAIFTCANGDKYVGEFKDDKRNGQGTFTYLNGDRYVGEFKDNKRNGNGKEFAASGMVTRSGYWIAGEYFGPTPPAGYKPPKVRTRIKMVKDRGTYTVPVTINGVLPLHFTVDSGAPDVSIPSDVVSTLIRIGALTRSDFIGSQEYQLADGSTIDSRTFRIRSLKVGERTVQNVKGSVADPNGSLLLGQSFLETFKSWSLENTKHELVLDWWR